MKGQQLGPYHMNFTPMYRYRLGARLAPYYVLHFSAHPFRRDLPSMGYKRPHVTRKRRRIEALIDAMIHIMMRGYTELVGRPLGASTGRLGERWSWSASRPCMPLTIRRMPSV